MKKNLLVVEAHSDDSAISIGGFLEKNRGLYNYHFLLVALSQVRMHHAGQISKSQRAEEYERYVGHMGGVWHANEEIPIDADSALDTVPRGKIVSLIEDIIDTVKPAVLICQGPSFHHDHTLVYESTVAATRPTARFFPKEFYVMENPTYVHSVGPHTDFRPNFYVTLNEQELEAKLACFRACFPSQLRNDSNYLSEEGIRSWARYRGIEARSQYAEAMQTHKRVI